VGLLDRLRLAIEAGDPVGLAREREALAGRVGERALQDGDRLDEPSLADRRGVERQADRVIFRLVPARADRDVQPAPGQDVDRGQLLGQERRVAEVVVVDERADSQLRGGRGDPGAAGDRPELRDVVIGDDELVVADRYGLARSPRELGAADDLARVGEELEWLGIGLRVILPARAGRGSRRDDRPAPAGGQPATIL
jgi:hypothetical protein